ncbi:MAG: redoxin domain-containing protein [Aureliella sp.]
MLPYAFVTRPFVKRIVASLVLLSGSSLSEVNAQQLAFSLPNVAGEQISLQADQNSASVICFLGTECPMARSYASKLSQLQQRFEGEGIQIYGVMSNRQDSLEDIRGYQNSLDVEFELLRDANNVVADQFGALRTPEVFLLDRSLKLRYRGRIDDQYRPSVARSSSTRDDLRIAIKELLEGKPISIKETAALGCVIGRAKEAKVAEDATYTFHQDITPILSNHCIECHRPNEIGPFAMQKYEEVVGWSETMLETMDDGRMPPWHADPAHGQFKNARVLPDLDREIFRQWVADGCPEGTNANTTAKTRIAQLEISNDAITNRAGSAEPDLVLPMRSRPFSVPRDGVVEYQYFVVDPHFEEDKWIRAAQVMPGSRDVVHHAAVFARPPDGSRFEGVGWLTAYVPGQRTLELPAGSARRVAAGSKLVFQMHYTPNGTERNDLSKIALWFADDKEVTHRVVTLMAINQEFEIPPETSNHSVDGELKRLPLDSKLLAITPHMHFRGKSFQLYGTARDPDSAEQATVDSPISNSLASTEILLSVPQYDFNWQHTYELLDPIELNRLETVRFQVTFDNSAANPFNPDPSETVTWGDQTWEEMALASFEVAIPRESNGSSRYSKSKLADDERQKKIEQYVQRVLEKMDRNGDGQIQESEGSTFVRHFNFRYFDKNDDGIATKEELTDIGRRLYK